MPILTDKRRITSVRESQKDCNQCNQPPGRIDRTSIIICDICLNWLCKDCASIEDKIHDFVTKNDIPYNYICPACRDEIPRIKDLIKISQKQTEMAEDLNKLKLEVEGNKKKLKEYEELDVKNRLSAIEKVIQENNLDDEHPPLPAINAATKQIQKDLTTQAVTTKKINTNIEEEKRKAIRSKNLIVYGMPETPNLTPQELMRSDFHKIRLIYSDRVDLTANDLTSIARLGYKNTDKIRPIRLTFADEQKRKEILINNKSLLIEGDNMPNCDCKLGGKHIHINVTTDKTKQEREHENQLREELKERRNKGDDVIIKRGKIVNRNDMPATTHPRWVDICNNGQ